MSNYTFAWEKKVEELRRDLRIKSQELEAKNAAANDKLKKMFKDQQEAEKKKVHTEYKQVKQATIILIIIKQLPVIPIKWYMIIYTAFKNIVV